MRKLFGLLGGVVIGVALVGCDTQTTTKRVSTTVEDAWRRNEDDRGAKDREDGR